MPVSTTTPASTYRPGLVATQITGIGLRAVAVEDLREDLQQLSSLVQAIEQAIETARDRALDAFAPDNGTVLQMPPGLTDTRRTRNGLDLSNRDHFFGNILGRRFEAVASSSVASTDPQREAFRKVYAGTPDHAPLTLHEWSSAAEALEIYAASLRSRLPYGQGGGPQYAHGAWFVNGERFTLSDLFIAVRVGLFTELDGKLAKELNTLSVNSQFARDVLSSLTDMIRIRGDKARSRQDNPTGNEKTVKYDPTKDFIKVIEAARDGRTRTLEEYVRLGGRLSRATSYIQEAANARDAGTLLTAVDYASLINEMRTLFDTLNADNQVQQLRLESYQNVRSNLLEGLSAFLKSDGLQNAAVRRNL